MNPLALLKMVREAGSVTNLAKRVAGGEPDPISGMRFLPGMEDAMVDPYSANLRKLMQESVEETGPNPWESAIGRVEQPRQFQAPKGPLTDMIGPEAMQVGRPRREVIAYDGPPDPQDPTTHGFNVYDLADDASALTIPGMHYPRRESMLREPRPEYDPLTSRAERMDEELAGTEDLIRTASSVDEFGPSGIPTVDRVLGLTREKRAKKYAKAFSDERKLDFADLPVWQRRQIMAELDYEGGRNADVPSTQGEGARKIRPLKDSKEVVNVKGRYEGPYAGIFPALARGAIRGSFVEELPPTLRVGENFPLRLHTGSGMDVRVKGIHTYDPQGPLTERLRLLDMMGRGSQDQGTFNKRGHVVEWEAIESIPMEGAASRFQVGEVRPIERRDGKIVQMEIVGADDKRLFVRPVIPEEGEAAVSNRLASHEEATKNTAGAQYKVADLLSSMSDFWKKNLTGRRVVTDEKGQSSLVKAGEVGNRSARQIDWRRAVSYALRSKAKPEDPWVYWSGARAVPIDGQGKKWVIVQQKARGKPASNQGVDIVTINEKGMASVHRYGPNGEDVGSFEVPMVRLFHQPQIDMIVPNLKEWKKRPPRPGKASFGEETPEQRAAALSKRLARAQQLQQRAPTATQGVPSQVRDAGGGVGYTVERRADKAGRSARTLTVQEFARVEPGETRTPATEKARTMVINELAGKKNLPASDLEGELRARMAENEYASPRRLANEVIQEADAPDQRYLVVDRVIRKLQDNAPLTPFELQQIAKHVSPETFAAFVRKGAPEWIKDNPGSSRVNMGTGGARDVTEGRTWVEGRKGGRVVKGEDGELELEGGEKFVRQPGTPPTKKPTFQGKKTKEGLTTIEGKAKPAPGLSVVDEVTVGDVKKRPGVIFISTSDVDQPNVVNIHKASKADIEKILGSETVVISKKTVASLTKEEKAQLARLKVGSKTQGKIRAAKNLQLQEGSSAIKDAREAREKGGSWDKLKAKLALDAAEIEKKKSKLAGVREAIEEAKWTTRKKKFEETKRKALGE